MVQELFDLHAGNIKVTVASRYQETEVFHIGNPPCLEKPTDWFQTKAGRAVQLALSFV